MSSSLSPLGQTTNIGSQIITLVAANPVAALSYTLTPSQSGSIVSVPTNGNQLVTITLPAPQSAPGFTCKVVIRGAVATGTVVITTGAGAANNLIFGTSINNNTLVPGNAYAAGNVITLINTTAIGSQVELFCDGTYYYFKAVSNSALAAAIVLTNA